MESNINKHINSRKSNVHFYPLIDCVTNLRDKYNDDNNYQCTDHSNVYSIRSLLSKCYP